MLKILQAWPQQYVNWESPEVQAGFLRGRGPEVELPAFVGSWRKQRSSRKTSASLTVLKPLTVWITKNCGKFLKRWEYQTCYLSPKKPVCRSRSHRIGHAAMDWFKIGKGVHQGCVFSLCLFNLYAEYIIWNARLISSLGIKIAGRNINSLRYAHDTILMAESKEEQRASW